MLFSAGRMFTIVLSGGDDCGISQCSLQGIVGIVHVNQPLYIAKLLEAPLLKWRQRRRPLWLCHLQCPLFLQAAQPASTRCQETSRCNPCTNAENIASRWNNQYLRHAHAHSRCSLSANTTLSALASKTTRCSPCMVDEDMCENDAG